jgi:hypothetical protein
MRIFDFDPADYRDAYARDGWIHIEEGMDPEFLALLQEFARTSLEETRLEGFAIKGKKEQSIFEFPDAVAYPDELYDVVSETCGLDRATITLSERHIQAYEPNAEAEPHPHKDRLGSQVSVGFSIDIPEDSRLVLYPSDARSINPFNSSKTFTASLRGADRPDVALRTAREVVIADRPGDVVMFPGSTTWHLRRNSARAVNLYVKFNDFGCDPLGEDPNTDAIRSRTLKLLASTNGVTPSLVPRISRRLDSISRDYTRNGWQEVLWAKVWGEEPFPLTETQYELVRAIDGMSDWNAVTAAVANGRPQKDVADELASLAAAGVIDLDEAAKEE